MSQKNLDRKGRLRSVIIGFRVSPEEHNQIKRMITLSGLNKQDYLTANMLHNSFIVQGNPRVFKGLKSEMKDICDELSRLSSASDIPEDLISIMQMAFRILDEMRKPLE